MWDARAMRIATAAVAALVLASCSTREQREHSALMDKIEKQAELPKGARPLNEYARLYADTGKGHLIAVYMLPSLIERGAARECASVDTSKTVPCVSDNVRGIRAGERRWVSEPDLPFEVARGCGVVTLAFDVERNRFDDVSCVGNRPVSY
jgi:hypothetical protein